jgi:prepilin-type N-terminal cleavage/methylation domain-containing protein
MPRKANLKGFTLVELLVVISIIAVLIALLLPALAKAKQLAMQVQCASNLRQLGLGCTEYASSYGGQLPANNYELPFGNIRWDWRKNPSNLYPLGWNAFYPSGFGLLYSTGIIKNPAAFYCPAAGYFSINPPDSGLSLAKKSSGWDPRYNGNYTNLSSNHQIQWSGIYFSYCYWYDHDPVLFYTGTDNPDNPVTAPGVIDPATLAVKNVLLTNSPSPFVTLGQDNPNAILGSDIAASDQGSWLTSWDYGLTSNDAISNHVNGQGQVAGANVLYGDDSVSWVGSGNLQCNFVFANEDFWQ